VRFFIARLLHTFWHLWVRRFHFAGPSFGIYICLESAFSFAPSVIYIFWYAVSFYAISLLARMGWAGLVGWSGCFMAATTAVDCRLQQEVILAQCLLPVCAQLLSRLSSPHDCTGVMRGCKDEPAWHVLAFCVRFFKKRLGCQLVFLCGVFMAAQDITAFLLSDFRLVLLLLFPQSRQRVTWWQLEYSKSVVKVTEAPTSHISNQRPLRVCFSRLEIKL